MQIFSLEISIGSEITSLDVCGFFFGVDSQTLCRTDCPCMGFGVDDGGFDQSPPPAVLLVGIRADRYGYCKRGSDVFSLLDNTMKPTGTACWVLSGRCSRLGVVLLVVLTI